MEIRIPTISEVMNFHRPSPNETKLYLKWKLEYQKYLPILSEICNPTLQLYYNAIPMLIFSVSYRCCSEKMMMFSLLQNIEFYSFFFIKVIDRKVRKENLQLSISCSIPFYSSTHHCLFVYFRL